MIIIGEIINLECVFFVLIFNVKGIFLVKIFFSKVLGFIDFIDLNNFIFCWSIRLNLDFNCERVNLL